MSRPTLGNDAVGVTLEPGTWTLHWPEAAVVLGPCRGAVTRDGIERSTGAPGAWAVEPGTGFGRPGTWARWLPADDGPTVTLHVPVHGPAIVVTVGMGPTGAGVLDRFTVLAGATDLPYGRRLVEGYDSWAYSGVRGAEAGASTWNAAFAAPDGRGLVVQALGAARFCTRVMNDGAMLRVDAGEVPELVKQPGTWGYLVGDQPALGLPLRTAEPVVSEPVAVAAGADVVGLVEDLAGLAASVLGARRWAGPALHGWESWYHYGLFVTADDVRANARALRDRYRHRPDFDLVQIDDGWQQTYGAWWPNDRFPSDLREMVDELHGLGCRAGLWLAPFRVQPDAPGIAADHPDWLVGGPDDTPLRDERHGAFALDASNPVARAWLRQHGDEVRGWGFDMVKVDFCYLGALRGARHDPHVTGLEALDLGLRALLDGLGPEVYVLTCGMPVLPAVGIGHANRVGHDLAMPRALQELGHPIDAGWTGFHGVRAQARNVAARWAHAGRWYDADPEVVMAWGSDGADAAGYSIEEARTVATMVLMAGGPFLLADELDALRPDERAVLEHGPLLDLLARRPFRPVDVLAVADPPEVPQHAFSQGPGIAQHWQSRRDDVTVHAIFNWGEEPASVPTPAELVGGTELWTGSPAGTVLDVPAHGTRVIVADS